MNYQRKNLFKLEEEEFDIIEKEETPIIENQKSKKEIKVYPVKPDKKKSKKIKAKRNPLDFPIDKPFQIANLKDNLSLDAKDYPGEVVNHNNNYFISLRDDDGFSWFLLK
jgi:hypothetical protein